MLWAEGFCDSWGMRHIWDRDPGPPPAHNFIFLFASLICLEEGGLGLWPLLGEESKALSDSQGLTSTWQGTLLSPTGRGRRKRRELSVECFCDR